MRENTSINEIESVNNLLTLSVYFTIADCLDLDAMTLQAEDDLRKHLGMTDIQQQALFESIKDQFEGEQLDFSVIQTVQDIVDLLVTYNEYQRLH